MSKSGPSGLDIFDRAMSSVQQQRAQHKTGDEEKRVRLDAEWRRVVEGAETLKRRVFTDPRVKAFNISSRLQEIMVTIRVNEREPPRFIRISRQHPDQNYPGMDALWVRETGHHQDRRYDKADDLLREFALSLAHSLV